VDNGVNTVFNGHVHVYERYWENGIHYLVLGTGGGALGSLAVDKTAGYQNSMEHTLAYSLVTVEGENATAEIVKVADISEDNLDVINLYPERAVFESIELGKPPPVTDSTVLDSFSVGPPLVELEIPACGSVEIPVYINSTINGEVAVSTENLPFEVVPDRIEISDTDDYRPLDLELRGSEGISNETYSGKLVFLYDSGGNLSYGVKIGLHITQVDTDSAVEKVDAGNEDDISTVANFTRVLKERYPIIIGVTCGVLVPLFVTRNYRRRKSGL
jgi:hypothetical protein